MMLIGCGDSVYIGRAMALAQQAGEYQLSALHASEHQIISIMDHCVLQVKICFRHARFCFAFEKCFVIA